MYRAGKVFSRLSLACLFQRVLCELKVDRQTLKLHVLTRRSFDYISAIDKYTFNAEHMEKMLGVACHLLHSIFLHWISAYTSITAVKLIMLPLQSVYSI